MQLTALRYFVMVANKGSFSATAQHFQVPASSVSRYISALEHELGQQLLYRSTRSVRLTEAGEYYYAQVKEALDTLNLAQEELTGQKSQMRGLIRINAPVALGRLHIAKIVDRLQNLYPQLEVELMLNDTFINPIQDGFDITLRIGQLQDSALMARHIAKQHMLLCASPLYIKQHGVPQSPQDLYQHRCLVYQGHLGAQRWYFKQAQNAISEIIQPQGLLRSNHAEVLVDAALQGHGIVLFPTWIFSKQQFKHQQLVRLLTDWTASVDPVPLEINLISPENRIRSQKVRTVIDFILAEIGEPPYWDNIAY